MDINMTTRKFNKKSIETQSAGALNQQIRSQLESLAEPKYQKFSSALVPGELTMLGIRLPKLREIAKELAKGNWQEYLKEASDASMEEIMLQGMTIGYARASFEEKKPYITAFVPKIRNWSLCDSVCNGLKFKQSEKPQVWAFLQPYLTSPEEFEVRFGVVMLLSHFIDDTYLPQLFTAFDSIRHEGYYAKIAVAWAVCTCFRSHKEETIHYLKNCKLNDWTYNKSLQKIIESRYSTPEEKDLMRRMKRNTEKS